MRLHFAQKRLLELLKKNINEPLSVRELQSELGAKSPSVVQHHIKQLEKKGYLRRNPGNPRDYQILGEPDSDIVYLNMYGMAQCGPNGRLLDGSPIERVPVYTPLLGFPASEAFLVKARGKSMSPDIDDGDTVIARKASSDEANNNDIVVCVNESKVLIKRIQFVTNQKGKKQYILTSSNPEFKPFVANYDFRIEGKVKSIIKHSV